MKKRSHRFITKLAGTAILTALASLAVVGPSAAFATTNGGTATVVKPDGVTPLGAGGSATTWTFQLPPQAHCSGDSASQGFHVFSYIVPSTINPASLTFTSSGPSAGNPLYDTSSSPLIALNTAPTSGQVIGLPQFNWALFSPDGSAGIANPNGVYNVGIACGTGTGANDIYWNNVVTFTANASDPNMQVWTALNPSQSVPESPWSIALPLSAVAVLAGGAIVLWRRRSESGVIS